MPERDDAYAFSLCHTAEVRDRDARHTVDRVDAVELERIDDEVKAIRQLLLCFRRRGFAFRLHCSFSHWGILPSYSFNRDNRQIAPHDRPGRARGHAPVLPRDRYRALPELG